MKNASLLKLIMVACCFLLGGLVRADRIELTDGSIIKGKLISADGGKLKVETTFAGTILIAQDSVKTFATDEAVNVILAGGSSGLGKVVATEAGIKVEAASGVMDAGTAQVQSVWRKEAESPSARLLREMAEKAARKWAYEASVAITGRTGASEKFNAAVGFKATLESIHDRLIFALAAESAEDNGVKTSDRQFGGVDYSNFFSPDYGWYVRTSLESDEIKSLDLRSASAFGFSHKLVKKPALDLEVRVGASYLYESYSNSTNFNSPGLDITFLNTYTFGPAKLSSSLTYTPAFKDFANYRIRHESGLELPLTAALWKLKLGLANEYFSKPPAGVEKLDTTYFTSLILNWK